MFSHLLHDLVVMLSHTDIITWTMGTCDHGAMVLRSHFRSLMSVVVTDVSLSWFSGLWLVNFHLYCLLIGWFWHEFIDGGIHQVTRQAWNQKYQLKLCPITNTENITLIMWLTNWSSMQMQNVSNYYNASKFISEVTVNPMIEVVFGFNLRCQRTWIDLVHWYN